MSMEFIGRTIGVVKDMDTKLYRITIEADEETTEEMVNKRYGQNTKVSVSITPYREKRSGRANNYLWVLCDKIANHPHIRSTQAEVYLMYLFEKPIYETKNGHNIEGSFPEDTDINAYSVANKEIHHYWKPIPDSRWWNDTLKCFMQDYSMVLGSSFFDKAQMQELLERVVNAAKGLGIKTETDYDIYRMLEKWGEDYAKAQKRNN